ncbi:hypothetical protein [Nitrosomonas communis]|uniref:Secreted protein n=1 Tax=Nitrosomonas communis TaxID=44574 RepID=A0A1I4WH06_9PROT|nr:hypothetical protein [Nitrosomonas communis]SFN12553.1 hypothetical protein SAMN05421863_11085 [Nitrosomonas communis]
MNKFIISTFISALILGSTSVSASGNKESALTPIRAQDILNVMSCKDKKAEDQIKDRIDGTKVTCGEVTKKTASAIEANSKASSSGGGY